MIRTASVLVLGSVLSMLVGCAARNTAAPGDARVTTEGTRSPGGTTRELPAHANGLQIRAWRIRETTEDAGVETLGTGFILARHADGEVLDPDLQQRLRRNGLRFVRVPLDRLDLLLADLGGATMDVDSWHGQAFDWRSLRETTVPPEGRIIAMDGRARPFGRGRFRLLVRGWTMQMEQGTQLHFDMLPEYLVSSGRSFRRALGEEDASERFYGLRLDLSLEPGYGYILTAETPGLEWSEDGETEAARGETGDGLLGPDVDAPPTLGQLLFVHDGTPPMREVFVFIPRISSLIEDGRTAGVGG